MNLPHETHPTIANLQARIRELEGKEQNKASLAAEMRAEVVDPCRVKPLDRLIVSFPDNGTDWDRKMLASCGLKKGDLVTVQACYVNSWSSTFTLVGHGGNRFNSVFFSAYNERQSHTVFQQENEKALAVLARHKSATPRTDAMKFNFQLMHPAMNLNQDVVRADDAGKLEIELSRLQSMYDAATEIQGDDEAIKYVTSRNAIPVSRCTVSSDLLRQLIEGRSTLERELAEAKSELERERMRLAACGVVALSDTPESAKLNREMHADYRSASCDDVARRVDECMEMREKLAAANARIAELEALVK